MQCSCYNFSQILNMKKENVINNEEHDTVQDYIMSFMKNNVYNTVYVMMRYPAFSLLKLGGKMKSR